MNFRRIIFGSWLLALTLAVEARGLIAQDQPPTNDEPPKPAGYSFPGLGNGQSENEVPDSTPLTGIQTPTLGSPEIRHSYWVPGFQYSSNISSNSYGQTGGSNWYAENYFLGNLSLLEAWNRSTLAVNYTGGGFVSTDSAQGNGWYQQMALADTIQTQRWMFQILDQFAYIPQSSFGFGGGTNLGVPGVGGSLGTTTPGIGGNYTPNQSVYGVGPYYTNTGGLQATYTLSPRGSVTFSGSYALVNFLNPGNIDNRSWVSSIGYNYTLTRNDTIGLVYRFSAYQFPGSPQAYGSSVISLAYGRKVTGHLALRFFVGPEFTNYRVAVGGSSQTTGFSATANLTYAFRHASFSVNYTHGLSGGSGVLVGSDLDQITATFSHSLTRTWTGNVNVGYAHNSPVGGTAATGSPTYDSWYVGGGVNRPIGRNFNFSVAYTANISNYGGYTCTGTTCNNSITYNTVTVNFQWHPRPFVLP